MTPYIVSGLVLGSIYAISALGLVLTYTSSRVFNFAYGAIAFAMATTHYYLVKREGWNLWVSAAFVILVIAPLLGLFLWAALFRRLTHASPTVRLVSTVGLWVALPALTYILFPWANAEIVDPEGLVHRPLGIHRWLGITLNDDQAVVLVAAVVIAVGATLLMKFTPLGLAIRSTVDHPRNASIAGVNTEGATAVSWMIGTMLAALAGVLLTPIQGGLNISLFTLLLVASFAAAVVGKLRSLPLTFAGAMLIGVVQGLWPKIYTDHVQDTFAGDFLSKGVQASIPFLIMIIFLLAYKDLRREAFTVDPRGVQSAHGEAPPLPPTHGWKRAAGPLALGLVALTVPLWLSDIWVVPVTQGLALAVIFLSYTMVTGEGGLISLCQITLAGVGGFAAAMLASNHGWPVWAAILAGAVIAVPFGLLVALPSLRIGDLYLALLTLGGALLMENLVFSKDDFDNFGVGVELRRPFGLGIIEGNDRAAMYFVCLAVFAALALLIVNLKRATTGLVFASIRSSEAASLTTGISTVRAKLMVFAASAFIAGFGGALWSSYIGRANVRSFSVLVGIVWLAIVVTWGVRSVIGALMAGLIYALIQQRLMLLIVMVFLFVIVGVFVRQLLAKNYRTPRGIVTMVLAAIIGVVGSALLWGIHGDDIEKQTEWAAHALLLGVWLGITVGLLVRLIARKRYTTPLGAALTAGAAILVFGGAYIVLGADLSESALEVPTMMFGLGAVGLAREPRGVIYDMVNRQRLGQLQEQEKRREAELRGSVSMTDTMTDATFVERGLLLEAEGVTVRFGGVVALDDVSLAVPPNALIGLVGPNGAGKTTLFGVLSGLLRPKAGTVRMDGDDVTGRSPQYRAHRGLSRTFHRLELFSELTVREHLVVARRVKQKKQRFFWDLTGLGEKSDASESEAVNATLELLGLADVAEQPATAVPLGTGRLVEVGRALAGEPTVVLLDEPSSGLDEHETTQLADALRRVRAERGTSFVLVEHNVDLVLELSDRVTVLDFGKVLTEGTPEEIRNSPEVQAAYFGAPVETS